MIHYQKKIDENILEIKNCKIVSCVILLIINGLYVIIIPIVENVIKLNAISINNKLLLVIKINKLVYIIIKNKKF